MHRIKYFILTGLLLLAGCVSASDKHFNMAQESMKTGSFQQAFDQAAQSLQADISNKKTIVLFPAVVQGAYQQQTGRIGSARARADWDQVAHGYDRIISMNRVVKGIQQRLLQNRPGQQAGAEQGLAVHALLALQARDVASPRDVAYQQAAAAHYERGNQLFALKQYRQASHQFKQTQAFIADYQDVIARAVKSTHLADLADARLSYQQAKQAVGRADYRAAATAFRQADAFIPGFNDARRLAVKYKQMADRADARRYYNDGERLAQQQQYREAAAAFQSALGFVADYRDAALLAARYVDMANQADALLSYNKASSLMAQQQFAEAATAFTRANHIVPGFRDAGAMAHKARLLMPPYRHQLQALVQASVIHGVPLTWLDDVHQGYTEEVRIADVQIIRQGDFNARDEYWPYRLLVKGLCQLELPDGQKQDLSFETLVDYRIFRDDFGDRKAVMQ